MLTLVQKLKIVDVCVQGDWELISESSQIIDDSVGDVDSLFPASQMGSIQGTPRRGSRMGTPRDSARSPRSLVSAASTGLTGAQSTGTTARSNRFSLQSIAPRLSLQKKGSSRSSLLGSDSGGGGGLGNTTTRTAITEEESVQGSDDEESGERSGSESDGESGERSGDESDEVEFEEESKTYKSKS